MFSGTTVSVELRRRSSRDSFGNTVEEYENPVDVANVLVTPGACEDLNSTRPEGVKVALTLHMPKEWASRMRGARVSLSGPWDGVYRVVGDPMPYMDENCPTAWHMPVEVERTDG